MYHSNKSGLGPEWTLPETHIPMYFPSSRLLPPQIWWCSSPVTENQLRVDDIKKSDQIYFACWNGHVNLPGHKRYLNLRIWRSSTDGALQKRHADLLQREVRRAWLHIKRFAHAPQEGAPSCSGTHCFGTQSFYAKSHPQRKLEKPWLRRPTRRRSLSYVL